MEVLGGQQCTEVEGDRPDWSDVAKDKLKAIITKIPVATAPTFIFFN